MVPSLICSYMLIASKNKVEIDILKALLSSKFEMKDLGGAKKILGIEIIRDKVTSIVCLTHAQYMKKVLQRFDIDEKTKPVCTPITPYFQLSALISPNTTDEKKQIEHVSYANVISALMYAMVYTKHDISYVVSMVSRYVHNLARVRHYSKDGNGDSQHCCDYQKRSRRPRIPLGETNTTPEVRRPEYDSFVDSDLWDLPHSELNALEGESKPRIAIQGLELCSAKFDFRKFDLDSALNRIWQQVGSSSLNELEGRKGEWKFLKYLEEAEFGPGFPVNTVFLVGNSVVQDQNLTESCKWMSEQSCLKWLLEVKPSNDRVGPLIVTGVLNDSLQSRRPKIACNLNYQEYPPGVTVVPMRSRTLKPFRTTNLVAFTPDYASNCIGNSSFVAFGDALIVDPGCCSEFQEELKTMVAALPKKLLVFVTHHHHDHVDGLSVVQQCNPEATLLAHENTMRHIGKDAWSLGYTSVNGREEICVAGERLSVISAPGHTDGHMALLHISSHSLIVGDHCVGQGSAILDITSGGNMREYFETTYRFMELSPHALIPMHGRVNLWPKHMLCGYLKNRISRENSILKAIENGAHTLFDIVADVYSDVDRRFWIPAASNVRLHVDHLTQQNKLPKEFSIQKFQRTCGLHFLSRFIWAYISRGLIPKHYKTMTCRLVIAGAAAGFAVLYSIRYNFIPR